MSSAAPTVKVQWGDDIRRLAALKREATLSLAAFRAAVVDVFPELQQQQAADFTLSTVAASGSESGRVVKTDSELVQVFAANAGAKSIKFVVTKGKQQQQQQQQQQAGSSSKPAQEGQGEEKVAVAGGQQGDKKGGDEEVPEEVEEEDEEEDWNVVDQKEGEGSAPVSARASSARAPSDGNSVISVLGPVSVSHPNWLSATQTTENSDEKVYKVQGADVPCSLCFKPLKGTWYKCYVCSAPATHLCPSCESLPDAHNPLHALIKIKHPDQCPDTGVLARRKQDRGLVLEAHLGLPNDAKLKPFERFFGGWKIKNEGDQSWPKKKWLLRCVSGPHMNPVDDEKSAVIYLPPTAPGQSAEVLFELKAPRQAGKHSSLWRACDEKGRNFGPPLPINLTVVGDSNGGGPVLDGKLSVQQQQPLKPARVPRAVRQARAGGGRRGVGGGVEEEDEEEDEAESFDAELAQLAGMGFTDRVSNMRLLQQGKSVEQVIAFICNE